MDKVIPQIITITRYGTDSKCRRPLSGVEGSAVCNEKQIEQFSTESVSIGVRSALRNDNEE